MAVRIRLARYGRKKKPFYRVVAQDSQCPRDGKFLEILGTFDPLKETENLNLREERIKHWIDTGALPTQRVADIIRKEIPNYYSGRVDAQKAKIQARRKARKERLAAAAK